jgi:hypothetical protein
MDLAPNLPSQLLKLDESAMDRGGFGEALLDEAEPNSQGCEVLTHLVVEFPGNSAPFLLLGRGQSPLKVGPGGLD